MYLKRHIERDLEEWKKSPIRKPLLLRGARQVGKTSTIRQFGKSFKNYVEINFEENKSIHELFNRSYSANEIINNLSAILNTQILPNHTLLFFDEIQSCPNAISSLWFIYEKFPDLHLIAAGSLLEFAIQDLPSYGVGRIRSMFMYALSFDEFLIALDENILLDHKNQASPTNPLANAIHNKLINLAYKFTNIGGMPEVVKTYIQTANLEYCKQILDDIILSFNDDFAKYKKRIPASRLREVFTSVIMQTGKKFVYSNVNSQSNHSQIKESLELLILAGLVFPITHTSGNGLPLGAEANFKKQKMIIFDTGILFRTLKLNISDFLLQGDFKLVNKGYIAEQFVGLELIKSKSRFEKQSLYYWHRESKSSNAEIDYLIDIQNDVIPIEVKSGTSGSMKSMQQFFIEKNKKKGIRISNENFSTFNNIDVYPIYAVSNII